jgi:hypothetical protein
LGYISFVIAKAGQEEPPPMGGLPPSFITVSELLAQIGIEAQVLADQIERRERPRGSYRWAINHFDGESLANEAVLAATKPRQRNRKNELLRAFGAGFFAGRPDQLPSADLAKAIAITATVALDDADVVITSEDVRAILGRVPKSRETLPGRVFE